MITQQAIEFCKKFDAENGDFVVSEDWLYFQSGARREKSPTGVAIGPPLAEPERLKRVAIYWKLKLRLAVQEFDNAKQGMVQFAKSNAAHEHLLKYGPPNPKQAVAELERLKSVADEISKQYEKARAAAAGNQPQELKDREATDEKCRQEWNQYVNELESIEI